MEKKNFSSLENAIRLLDLFSAEEQDFSLKEIAQRLSIADSTAHRLLTTLKKEGFIAKNHRNNRYRLGVYIRTLESVVLKDLDMYTASKSMLDELSNMINGTVSLCILNNHQTFYVNSSDSGMSLYSGITYLGKMHSLLSSSAGYVLISKLTEIEVQKIISMEHHSYSFQQKQQILKELSCIEQQGYAISYNNFNMGLTSIAVPVFDKRGSIIAAIELIISPLQLKPTLIHTYKTKMQKVAIALTDSFYKKQK